VSSLLLTVVIAAVAKLLVDLANLTVVLVRDATTFRFCYYCQTHFDQDAPGKNSYFILERCISLTEGINESP